MPRKLKTEKAIRAMLEEQQGLLAGTPWWENEEVQARAGVIAALEWVLGHRSDDNLLDGGEADEE